MTRDRCSLLLGIGLAVVATFVAATGCSIVEEPDGGLALADAEQPDKAPPEPPPPGGDLIYRFTVLQIETPESSTGSGFAQLGTLLFQVGFDKSLPDNIPPVNLLARIIGSDTDTPTFELCQAHGIIDGEPVNDVGQPLDGYQCSGLPYQIASAPATIEGGRLTVGPFDFDFLSEVPTGSIFVFIRLAELTIEGDFDPATGFNGAVTFKLPVTSLCAAPFKTNLFCPDPEQPDGENWSNLLDAMDGPEVECGQDGSADYYHPTALGSLPDPAPCTTGTAPDHYPPDTTAGGEPAYTVSGTLTFEPDTLIDGPGPIPLRKSFGEGLCTESADEPCDKFRNNQTWLEQ